jgi:hypothetical protein
MAQELDGADDQLRSTLSTWRQRRRSRAKILARYRKDPVRHSVLTDIGRELEQDPDAGQWFLIALLVLTIIDFLWLRYCG